MVRTANRCGLLADAVSASPKPLPVAKHRSNEMRKVQSRFPLANGNLSTPLLLLLPALTREEYLAGVPVKEREAREESSSRRHAIAMAIASAMNRSKHGSEGVVFK